MVLRKRGRASSRRVRGKRSSSISRSIRASRRASGAPRQWWTPPAPEQEVGAACAPDIETVGIAVGGAEKYVDVIALFQRMPVDSAILDHAAEVGLHRRIEAHQLLDRGGDEAGIVAQALELVGVAQEREDAVADQIDGGLVPGDEEQTEHVQHFTLGEALARVLGVDQALRMSSRGGARHSAMILRIRFLSRFPSRGQRSSISVSPG